MKYWNNLMSLESEIIRLDSMNSLLNVLAEGIESSSTNDIKNTIWYVQGSIEDINKNISEKFSELFDVIRQDTFNEADDESEEEYFSEDDAPKYNFEPLEDVVNSWIKS